MTSPDKVLAAAAAPDETHPWGRGCVNQRCSLMQLAADAASADAAAQIVNADISTAAAVAHRHSSTLIISSAPNRKSHARRVCSKSAVDAKAFGRLTECLPALPLALKLIDGHTSHSQQCARLRSCSVIGCDWTPATQ